MQPARVSLVLVPLDGSELAEEAIGPGVSVARQLGAPVEFVRVVNPTAEAWDGSLGVPIAVVQENVVKLKLEAHRYLTGVRSEVADAAPSCSGVVLTASNAAHAIADHAHKRGAELVAMASHRAGWVERTLLGSVTDKVLRSEVGAVLVVRPGAPD
jgi:nucleotide-binding universal stress UspA family protein